MLVTRPTPFAARIDAGPTYDTTVPAKPARAWPCRSRYLIPPGSSTAAPVASPSSSPFPSSTSVHVLPASPSPQFPTHQGVSDEIMSGTGSFSPCSNQRRSSIWSDTLQDPPLSDKLMTPVSPPNPFSPHQLESMSSIVTSSTDAFRGSILDESALSPSEYETYVPILSELSPAPSGLQGLYDELGALQFLRSRCRLDLKDEALILALFERTPLGIQSGHFYAWLRLVSWVQQGHAPTKQRLFMQTEPAQLEDEKPPDRTKPESKVKRTIISKAGHPPPAPVQLKSSGRHAGVTATKVVRPTAQKASKSQFRLELPAPTHSLTHPSSLDVPSVAHLPPGPSHLSHQDPHLPHIPSPPMAPPTTHIVAPPYGGKAPTPAGLKNRRVHSRSGTAWGTDHLVQPQAPLDAAAAANGAQSAEHERTSHLPLDALIGSNPASNRPPLKQSTPRVVRPTPVIATRTTTSSRPAAPLPLPSSSDPAMPPVPIHSDLRPDQSSIEDSTMKRPPSPPTRTEGFPWRMPTSSSRAPISPLIQAGLDAASQAHRARQSRPSRRTYTTIGRSGRQRPGLLYCRRATSQSVLNKVGMVGEQPPDPVVVEEAEPAAGEEQKSSVPPPLLAPQPRHASSASHPM